MISSTSNNPEKASASISSKPLGKSRSFRDSIPARLWMPIVFTVSGIFSVLMYLQFAKALLLIASMPYGNIKSPFMLRSSANALFPIAFICDGSFRFSRSEQQHSPKSPITSRLSGKITFFSLLRYNPGVPLRFTLYGNGDSPLLGNVFPSNVQLDRSRYSSL